MWRFILLLSFLVLDSISGGAVDTQIFGREDREWCDDVLGCLYLTDDWTSAMRPLNVLPKPRAKINTQFYLHTREDPSAETNVVISADDPITIEHSTFDPSKETKIICHGFIDTGNIGWMKEMAQLMLAQGDFNVIRVDWGDGSLPLYTQATANARVVGLEIGHLVNTMKDNFGLDPAKVHLLGHSLGSHISGYAGEKIEGLGRITGMDPAGPYYTGTPTFIRLDPSDAIFVDAIHTDADSILLLGYGTGQPMGNIDLYPNSGHDMPGCDPVNIGIDVITDIGEGGREIAACSHDRSHKYVADALKYPECNYLAHECFDYGTFLEGKCGICRDDNSKCAFLGLRAEEYPFKDRKHVKMYFDTSKDEPYCLQHYRVSVLTAKPSKAEEWVMGHLLLTLYGENGNIIEKFKVSKEHERIDHGQLKHFLFTSNINIESALRVEAKWVYDDNVLNPGTYCWSLFCDRSLYVDTIEISPINYYPESERVSHTRTLCSMSGEMIQIKDGHTESFMAGHTCVPVENVS